jgi:hypothetical protein
MLVACQIQQGYDVVRLSMHRSNHSRTTRLMARCVADPGSPTWGTTPHSLFVGEGGVLYGDALYSEI